MTARQQGEPRRIWVVTIDSDWITAFLMAALLIICGLFLARDVHELIRGKVVPWPPLQRTFFDILTRAFEVAAAVYCLLAGLRDPTNSLRFGKPVRCALLLVGINLAGAAIFGFFHSSPDVRYGAALIRTITMQIALIIFCYTIANWFRSVVHWNVASGPSGGGSET